MTGAANRYPGEVLTDLANLIDRVEANWDREGSGPGSRFEGERREHAVARGVDTWFARIRDEAVIQALEDAHAEARANCRRAWDEMDDNDIAMHWSGVAGWLRHRIIKIKAGEEPDWPDAFTSEAQR